ncbi:hypothetical protein HN748_01080 [Candidatus Peregrinibacteria bacterium]|jgi:hypothetical protein|nr:hypothetical protein [Candidatus Peregrinibacteria bacterium]MBT7483603.1 hypothetical protein [Candidatus Peregrinibacteria bacterium]MBT7702805.1 hypothetical protein [Candidatus Peregrinibacteria bacterium]
MQTGPTQGRPDIISPCPLLREQYPNRRQPDTQLLEPSERDYLESLEPEQLEVLIRMLQDLSMKIFKHVPDNPQEFKFPPTETNKRLLPLFLRIMKPLQEHPDYRLTCRDTVDQLKIFVERIRTKKNAIQATEVTADQPPKPSSAEIREEAIESMKRASKFLQQSGFQLPNPDNHLAVNRYALACVVLILSRFQISEVTSKNILNNPTPSLPIRSQVIEKAITNLAELIGMRPMHLKLALGIGIPNSIAGTVIVEKRKLVAGKTLPLISTPPKE